MPPPGFEERAERTLQSESQFHFTVIQGKIRGRVKLIKLKGGAALVVADRVLKIGKHLMLVRSTGGDNPHTNRLVQLHATVEKGDDEKRGYVLRLLHAQCPAGLDVLLSFLEQELGISAQNPALSEMMSDQAGPVTFRFDTKNFEMGGAKIDANRDEPQPVYRATPIARRIPMAQDVAAAAQARPKPIPAAAPLESGPAFEAPPDDRSLPELEGDPDEFVSMFGMKVKRGQFDKLGDLTYKPGGAGNAVRSAKREDEADGAGTEPKKKKKKTGLLKRVARKLSE